MRRASVLLLLALVTLAPPAIAQTLATDPTAPALPDDEVSARLRFIEARLHREARGARLWEASWSLVYVGGFGYGIYQVGTGSEVEGLVGASKSLLGGVGLALRPLATARAAHVLDLVPDGTPAERARRLALAEQLLRQNAAESQLRLSWQHHLISLALNLAGGAIIWIAGDRTHALESTGLAVAAGEVNIWTRPWRAVADLRAYRQTFGGRRF